MTILYSLFDDLGLAETLCAKKNFVKGKVSFHTFPDDEICPRLHEEVNDQHVIFIAYLDRPTSKLLPLLLSAATARQFGAKQVDLIVPYLPYMRQDKVFLPGEGITSQHFANILSAGFDKLITIDPHLHRWHSLSQIYSISTTVLHATQPIAMWVEKNVNKPLLIGPDSESQQWVKTIADHIQAPFVILEKTRKNDTEVEISLPNLKQYPDHEVILVDDIISTAHTMLKAAELLKTNYQVTPICLGVHGVFAANAYEKLNAIGIKKIITCNTIRHITNAIDIHPLIIESIFES